MADFLFSEIEQFIGQELGVSEWTTVKQAQINQFAEATGDHQWIHVDVERAERESPYKAPIAHGYLSLALIASLSMQAGAVPSDAAAVLNYGIDKVRFLAPVKVGSRVRLRVSLLSIERKSPGQVVMKTGNTLEIEGSPKPALIAETLVLAIERAHA